MPVDDRRRSPVPPGDRRPPHRLRLLAPLLTTLFVVVALFGASRPAAAHTKLVESEPANVSQVAPPVDSVRLTFTKASEPVRDRFTVTGPDGATITPASVDNDGDKVVVAKFADPLPEGRNRVRWAIRAGDTHVMTGSLAFTVTPAATPAATPPTDDAAAPTTTPGAAEAGAAEPAAATDTDATPVEEIDARQLAGEQSSGFADLLATFARWLLFGALLLTVGGLAYLARVHGGSAAETRRLVFWVRRAAVAVVAASLLAWFAQVMLFGGLFSTTAWGDVFTSYFAVATLLRLVGAGLVLRFLRMDLDTRTDRGGRARTDTPDPFAPPPTGGGGVAVLERPATRTITRFAAASSPLALVGAVLLLTSESYTGHTATTAPWPLVVVSDFVHVAAAAIWAAGIWMLTGTLWRRRRDGAPLDARMLAVRFSVMATWALVAVAVSGVLLAWTILDGAGALWSTGFGRLLLAKVFVVAVVAGIGAYNHRVLVPALDAADDTTDDTTDTTFLRTVTTEAVLFVVVVGLTALLVAASPV